eukprot:365642-Chlamydomonas_euryale.AAC.9
MAPPSLSYRCPLLRCAQQQPRKLAGRWAHLKWRREGVMGRLNYAVESAAGRGHWRDCHAARTQRGEKAQSQLCKTLGGRMVGDLRVV